jgi:hypothetical protein
MRHRHSPASSLHRQPGPFSALPFVSTFVSLFCSPALLILGRPLFLLASSSPPPPPPISTPITVNQEVALLVQLPVDVRSQPARERISVPSLGFHTRICNIPSVFVQLFASLLSLCTLTLHDRGLVFSSSVSSPSLRPRQTTLKETLRPTRCQSSFSFVSASVHGSREIRLDQGTLRSQMFPVVHRWDD